MRESYDVERGNGTESRCCVATAESKEESIRDMKWRPADRRTGGRAKQIKTRKVKQEGASNNGMVFRLNGRGVGDECGLVPKLVHRGEEVINREVGWVFWGEENIRDIV